MPFIIIPLTAALISLGLAATIAGVIATAIVIGAGILAGAVILGIVLKPKTGGNASTVTSLSESIDPNAYRKIVLGNAPAGNDVRYWEVFGANAYKYDLVVACATHKITSFQNLYIEGAQETFATPPSSGASTGKYVGLLSKNNVAQGVTASGITVGVSSLWTSAMSMTGLGYYVLHWQYDRKKTPNGIPTKIVQVIEGSPIYDPRKDSTQGGSGTHRATDCTTWTYSDLDSNSKPIGRNNALQMLRYLLGWHITSPQTSAYILVDGRGIDPNDIDYANFINAANVCETQGYYTDCVLSTGDDHSTNEGIISLGAQGVLLDSGGLWSYHPAYDDTASIAVALTQDDVVSGGAWNPRTNMSNMFNQIGGNFVDPSLASLYQGMPYPVVSDSTYITQDGRTIRQTLDFQCIQDPALAQKLARIALNKSRATGTFTATFNYKILQANNYECITLTYPYLGWVARLFRITSMAISPMGGVDCVLQEEYSSVYTGGTVTTYVTPATGIAYDPAQSIQLGALTLSTVDLANPTTTYAYDGIFVYWPAQPATVGYVEVEYQINKLLDPNSFSTSNWIKVGCTIGTGITDRNSGTNAFSLILTTTSTDDNIYQTINDTINYTGRTLTGGFWLKIGTLTGNVTFSVLDNTGVITYGTITVTPTSTWTYVPLSFTVASTTATGIRFKIDPVNNAGTSGQTVLFSDMRLVDENQFHTVAPINSDRIGIVLPNIVPNTPYVVRGRTLSINEIPGAWSEEVIKTASFSTSTQNQTFYQTADPTSTQTVNNGAVWGIPSGATYLRINGSWVQIASAPTITDGTVLFSTSASGAGTFTIPSPYPLAHVWVDVWSEGGPGNNSGGKSPTYYGGAGGSHSRHLLSVTAGQVISFNLGINATFGTNGGTSTATATGMSLSCTGGGAASTSAASTSPGTATGGGVANNSGSNGGTPNTYTGGAAGDTTDGGGAAQTTVLSNGNNFGGGGSSAIGGIPLIRITAKT